MKRFGWLILCIWYIGVDGSDLTCQLETYSGESLQHHLQLRCNKSEEGESHYPRCKCDTIFNDTLQTIFYNKEMIFINIREDMYPALDSNEAGKFYLTDEDENCVLADPSKDGYTLAPNSPCPPGFYCEGGGSRESGWPQPESCYKGDHCPGGTKKEDKQCHEGYFCHTPLEPMIVCPDGATCPAGSSMPDGCDGGYYCRGGWTTKCREGTYCPFGSAEEISCPFLTICNEGSSFKDLSIICFLILLCSAIATFFGARSYHSLIGKRRGRMFLCLVFACVSAFSWLLSTSVGIFLTTHYVIVVGNWLPMQVGTFPPLAARLVLATSLISVLAGLWFWHPQMAVFLAGMIFLGFLGFLMSRQSKALKYLGRFLLVLTCGSLVYVMFRVDYHFTYSYLSFIVVALICLVGSWMFNVLKVSRQGRREVVLPNFVTRWQATHLNSSAPEEDEDEEEDARHDEEVGVTRERGKRSSQSVELSPRTMAAQVGQSTRQPEKRSSANSEPMSTALISPGDCVATESLRSNTTESLANVLRGDCVANRDTVFLESRGMVKGVSFQLSKVDFELFDGKKLLNDVTLDVQAGSRVAVMGPSGSGKSTLLAVLSGRASYGRVQGDTFVSGRKTTNLAFLRHVTGYVPQDDVLHGELSVRENVIFQAALRLESDKTESQLEEAVAEVLANLGLSQLAEARVGTAEKRGVSGGQRKRVSIAMELVGKPLLLFADEPTSGLDSTTSHEVVGALNRGAKNIGTTVIAVIHQPRYQTLNLFNDLVLLGAGGCLVYADSTSKIKDYFQQQLRVKFPEGENPADVILDEIQLNEDTNREPSFTPSRPQFCAEVWSQHIATRESTRYVRSKAKDFHRPRLPLVRSMLVFMDRSMRQQIRSYQTLLINYVLIMGSTMTVCTLVDNKRFDNFVAQASFVSLAMMLLQGVAAQRTFGADLLITWREAQVGVPIIPYFLGKDLASLFEITVSAIVFTATYGAYSKMQLSLPDLFVGSWSFIYSLTGLNFIFSIVMGTTAAQMTAVVSAFVCFVVAGVFNPPLPVITKYFGGRGWMIPALSPIRWFVGYLITQEAEYLTPITKMGAEGQLDWMGYYLSKLPKVCGTDDGRKHGEKKYEQAHRIPQQWIEGECWVCTVSELILLGILFRYIAGMCLILYVSAHNTGWASFFTQAQGFSPWKLFAKAYTLLVAAFVVMFLFGEIWVLGSTNMQMWHLDFKDLR